MLLVVLLGHFIRKLPYKKDVERFHSRTPSSSCMRGYCQTTTLALYSKPILNGREAMRNYRYYFIYIASIAALAGILFGFDTGVISGAILFINQSFHLSHELTSLVVSMVLLGALLGAFFSGRATDIYGRKYMLLFDALLFIIGTAITALTPSITFLIIGRLLVGIAIGIASYTAPLYIAEISPAEHRGALVSLNQLSVTIGIFISYIVDYFFSFVPHDPWRWMLGFGVIPASILFLGVLTLPFSPRWLVYKGRIELALAALMRIRHGHAQENIQKELKTIEHSMTDKHQSWKLLFSKKIRPTFYIAAGLAIIQQITGINTILYYAPTIFKMAGFAQSSGAILATMGIGAVFVISTIVAIPFVDRLGRKPLLYTGMIIMAVGLGVLSWSFHGNLLQNKTVIALAIASMMLYIIGFGISLGPIMWLTIAEIFPLPVRGIGSSLATCINWGSNWLVAITFLGLVDLCNTSGAFLIYCLLTVLSLIFIYAYVPETKGTSLEQIEANLYRGLPARELGRQNITSGETTCI